MQFKLELVGAGTSFRHRTFCLTLQPSHCYVLNVVPPCDSRSKKAATSRRQIKFTQSPSLLYFLLAKLLRFLNVVLLIP